jgi:hypothetical protein
MSDDAGLPDAATWPTTVRLARALEAALLPVEMVRRARAGYYHDFLSELAMPETQLVADLRAHGQHALARRVIDGEFDATLEESDAWAESPDGRAVFRSLLRDRPKEGR